MPKQNALRENNLSNALPDSATLFDFKPTRNIFTVDCEEWFDLNHDASFSTEALESRIEANLEVLLKIFSEHKAQATFFFLGEIAKKFPDLVRTVRSQGHEIASHGSKHRLVYKLTREEFVRDVKESLDILGNIIGEPVKGYRSPFWSISDPVRTPWAIEVLTGLGLVYDSSIFPFRTYLYGDGNALTSPFKWITNGRTLYEFPATVFDFGRIRIPFGGGFYLRLMPHNLTRLFTKVTNQKGRPVIYYIHPREIDPQHPRLPLSTKEYLVSYLNLNSVTSKINKTLQNSPTISIQQFLELNGIGQAASIK